MQPKVGASQGATSNSEMTNAGQDSNISSNEIAADKTTIIVNQSAHKASMSPAQSHRPTTNVGGQHHNQNQHQHHHQQQNHNHHHQQQQLQQHHHHHHHAAQSNSQEPADYGQYQNQQQASYYQQGRHRHPHKSENESPVNHVILITVINPHYPITCDLIHQICGTYGKVNRIVIFKKNGVQAMVEFDGIEPAKRAKAMLQGCDIYSGCCTLRVEFAKPVRLNVHKNNSESFDYTNVELGTQNQPAAPSHANAYLNKRETLKPNIPPASDYQADQDTNSDYVAVGDFLSTSHCVDHNHTSHYNDQLQSHPHNHQGTVMMVYGLNPDRINCDRLFNLFCLYGNVVRVKFLRTKEGCAMVQMGDVLAVDRCVSSLNKITLFGNELQISYSKQAFLHDVIQPFALPDGSPSFKDFMGNKNNRFKNPEVASKNRILPPSKVLHFFNAPHGISEDELVHLFKQATDCEPMSVKIFTPKAENAKSYSGLVTFRDPAEATEALVLCNHISMPKAGAPHPYILRLCFSPPTHC